MEKISQKKIFYYQVYMKNFLWIKIQVIIVKSQELKILTYTSSMSPRSAL